MTCLENANEATSFMKSSNRGWATGSHMNAFQWLAGADRNFLGQCSDSEKHKITGFGTVVLIPAITGLFSMSYAVSTLTDNQLLYCGAGMVWLVFILWIERFMVSTFHRTRLEGNTNLFWVIATRYLFAVLVGITVAHPMTLLLFNDNISSEIREDNLVALDKNYMDYREKVDAANIATGLKTDSLESRKSCLQTLKTAEQSGQRVALSCGFSSGLPGNSKRCDEIQKQIDDMEKSIQAERDQNRADLESFKSRYEDRQKAIEASESHDYLARMRKLNELESDADNGYIRVASWFLTLFFVFLDILPLTLKVATPYGEYEAVKDKATHKTIKTCEAEMMAVEIYTPLHTTVMANKLMNEAKVHEAADFSAAANDMVKAIETGYRNSQEVVKDSIKNAANIQKERAKKSLDEHIGRVLAMADEMSIKGSGLFSEYLESYGK